MTFNRCLIKPTNKSVTIDCDLKEKNNNTIKLTDYADLISPGVLNEKEVCSGLDFFSTKAPKKKQSNLKKITIDENLKGKRRRLENYFSTIDLDSWSERNFIFPNKSEDFHDDLHYIVLKQQERSNFIHQIWLFLMLALFCVLLISIAGVVYQKNSIHKDQLDQSNSYEFIQKFIQDFNHTDAPRIQPDPANQYVIDKKEDDSNKNWLEKKVKYLSSLISNEENQLLNLKKKESTNNKRKQTRSVRFNEPSPVRSANFDKLNQVDYELFADESRIVRKIEDKVEGSLRKMAKATKDGLKKLFKEAKDIF